MGLQQEAPFLELLQQAGIQPPALFCTNSVVGLSCASSSCTVESKLGPRTLNVTFSRATLQVGCPGATSLASFPLLGAGSGRWSPFPQFSEPTVPSFKVSAVTNLLWPGVQSNPPSSDHLELLFSLPLHWPYYQIATGFDRLLKDTRMVFNARSHWINTADWTVLWQVLK